MGREVLGRERPDHVSRLQGRDQKWGEEAKSREQRPRRDWIQSPRGGSWQERIQLFLCKSWKVSVTAEVPEVSRVGVEGVHEIKAVMD